jgi:acyl-CoA reductase-like NAD-dependent aldehyde dehydrogenase
MKLESINPFTGELIESFDPLTDSQIEACIEKARLTQKVWKKTPISLRADCL